MLAQPVTRAVGSCRPPVGSCRPPSETADCRLLMDHHQLMRVAWFSPLPPVRSGIAAVNASLLPRLDDRVAIDRFVAERHAGDNSNVFDAHDFVWKTRREPYDLVVYQLGNAACHDDMWA